MADPDTSADSPTAPEDPSPRATPHVASPSPGEFDEETVDANPTAADNIGADPIDTAWAQVQDRWGDDEAHARFLTLCVQLGRMPEAGRRYREVRERHAGGTAEDEARAAEAQHRIDKLVGFAMANMMQQRTEPSTAPRRTLTIVAAVLMLASILAATWTVLRFTG